MNEPILPKLHKAFPCPHVLASRKPAVMIGYHPLPLAAGMGMEPADFHLCAECAQIVLVAIDTIMEAHGESSPPAGST